MNTAYLILGGNKGDKLQNLQRALQLIEQNVGVIVSRSAIFSTAPWGNANQPEFVNQAICIHTALSAVDLLKELLSIEKSLGRIRDHQKWMERTMDIDILFFNDEVINLPELKIPHPFLQDRKFVLAPLAQIAPQFIHPVLKKNSEILLSECTDTLEVTITKTEER